MALPRSPLRFFRPEVEVVLKAIGGLTLLTVIVLPTAWGYEQRKQARTWQNVACSYRLREITQQSQLVPTVDIRGDDPCSTLRRLGLELRESRVAILRR
jgi:hypothetical protein